MRGTGVIDQRLMTAHMIRTGVGLGDMLEPQIMGGKKLDNRIGGTPVNGQADLWPCIR